jgi:hypothetical protein
LKQLYNHVTRDKAIMHSFRAKFRGITLWMGFCLLMTCAACARQIQPIASPTPVPPTVTPRPYRDRTPIPSFAQLTLPPTFTATFTPTITKTPTPRPLPTQTLTPTTIPEEVLCQRTGVVFLTPHIEVYTPEKPLAIQFVSDYDTVMAHFTIRAKDGDEEAFQAIVPITPLSIYTLNPADFPQSGQYEWQVTLAEGGRDGLCSYSGEFQINRERATPTVDYSLTPDTTMTRPTSASSIGVSIDETQTTVSATEATDN